MTEYYGSVNALNTIQYITALEQTGDMHIMAMDFDQNLIYVSNASPWVDSACINAYDRPFMQFNMTTLFNLPQSK